MWAAIDTIFDCWARMNLNERTIFWLGVVAFPIVVLIGGWIFVWSGFVFVSAEFLQAAADTNRTRYDGRLHRRAFLLWAGLVFAVSGLFAVGEFVTANNLVDMAVPTVYALVAGWLGAVLALVRLNPRFDYRIGLVRHFDPAIPGTRKYAESHPEHSAG